MATHEALTDAHQRVVDFNDPQEMSREVAKTPTPHPEKGRRIPLKAAFFGLLFIASLTVGGALYAGRAQPDRTLWEKQHFALCDGEPNRVERVECHIETELERWKHLIQEEHIQGDLTILITFFDAQDHLVYDSQNLTLDLSSPQAIQTLDREIITIKNLKNTHEEYAILSNIDHSSNQTHHTTYGVYDIEIRENDFAGYTPDSFNTWPFQGVALSRAYNLSARNLQVRSPYIDLYTIFALRLTQEGNYPSHGLQDEFLEPGGNTYGTEMGLKQRSFIVAQFLANHQMTALGEEQVIDALMEK